MKRSLISIALVALLLPSGAEALESPGKGGVTIVDGLPGWWHAGSNPTAFEVAVDRRVTHGGRASARLRSVAPVPAGFGSLLQVASASRYRGKRVRLSAWLKTAAVTRHAGLWFRVDGPDQDPQHALAFDAMANHPTWGTTDWHRCDLVFDVAPEAADVAFGVHLSGPGTIWADDFKIEVVDRSVPITRASSSSPRNLDFER